VRGLYTMACSATPGDVEPDPARGSP
jgi:hypothetical protein